MRTSGFKEVRGKRAVRATSYAVILIALSLLSFHAGTRVFAVVPQITEIVVWTSGSDTVLNVTVIHSPETSSHYVNSIEVDVDGEVQAFPVNVQPSTTFVCNATSDQ